MLKKLAIVLLAGIFVFSALAYQREQTLKADAAASALLGDRPGGIVINAPAPASGATATPAAGAPATPALALPAAADGAACP